MYGIYIYTYLYVYVYILIYLYLCICKNDMVSKDAVYKPNIPNFIPALFLFRYAFWILLAPAARKRYGPTGSKKLAKCSS